jgi:hypothetical protein
MRRTRTTSALLGVVILLVNVSIVVAVVSLAGWGRDSAAPPASASTSTGTPTASASSTSGPSSAASSGPSSGPSSAPSSGTTTAATDAAAQAAQAAALVGSGRDVTISVLGDGTGDEEGEWVQVLATQLGRTHQVALNDLDPSDPTRYTAAVDYGEAGPRVTIWNGSRAGVDAGYAAQRLGFLVPSKPDVVLLSYGRDDKAATIAGSLTGTYAALRGRWPDVPVLLVLQPPDRDDAIGPVRVAAEDWATSASVPTIDVAAAFSQAGDPNSFVSVVDPPSVNARGGRLWAQTVLTALGG